MSFALCVVRGWISRHFGGGVCLRAFEGYSKLSKYSISHKEIPGIGGMPTGRCKQYAWQQLCVNHCAYFKLCNYNPE